MLPLLPILFMPLCQTGFIYRVRLSYLPSRISDQDE